MTEREMKKLRRVDLLEMLLAASKENEQLREQLQQMSEKLENRRIEIENVGSIAEAALKLNGVFEAAERAAEQYLDNIKSIAQERELNESEKENA